MAPDRRFRAASCTNRSREAATPSAQAQDAAHGLSLWEFRNNGKHLFMEVVEFYEEA
jgi:hypothetical protein